ANVCQHLRAKKMYIPAQADEIFPANGEPVDYCGHCWCNRTLSEVGADDKQVGLQICNPSRACFEE
ncbi:MAG TPA: hypothetical protein VFM25_12505, partial [Verrucomicrobiae bacterium]|nr:hypothetical protein [Verrucomicrobiae bacterium]